MIYSDKGSKILFMGLTARVKETIRKHRLFSFGERLLVAVSGGPDSVALLYLLHGLKEELGLSLEVAHLEHGLRGEEAVEDARFVAGMAERLALPFHLKRVDLLEKRGSGNLEAMAREERYRFFADVAERSGLDKIATAHTRDDQVETLLMRLLRGSGRKGLGAMPPVSRPLAAGPLVVRPLIETSRKEILDYLAVEGLDYRTDRTNLDPHLLRNWIRLELLPMLRKRIDPGLDERLARLADLWRDEEALLAEVAKDRFKAVARGMEIDSDLFLRQEKALQRRLIRLWFETVRGDLRAVDFDHVEESIRFVSQGPPQGRLSIPGGWELVKQYGIVRLEEKRRGDKPACYSYVLPQEGEIVIAEAGKRIQSSLAPCPPRPWPESPMEALFDPAFLPKTLIVRNFRPGDRFRPLGMEGHKKIKELFIEKKVPLAVRATQPLLLADGEILWIAGYGRSEIARVRAGTRRVLRVKMVALEGDRASEQY